MNSEVEEVKARTDIVDLISQYVTLKKAGANYKGVCPFHQEKTGSLMVSPQKQIWKCFGCGKGGDQFSFIMEAEHLEFGDALRLLAQKAGVTLAPRTQAEHQTQGRKERLFRINQLTSRVFHKLLTESPHGKPALEYLKKRGLTDVIVEQFRLGFAPRGFDLKKTLAHYQISPSELGQVGSPEKFYNRIMFPIFDVLGNVIAFTGRSLGEGEPKYLNSPETPLFNKSRVLYGLNFAKAAIKERDFVILVEGQMDVIALHQAGVAQTVASSGTAITETQLVTLSKYTPNFLLAFDNDSAGRQTTKKVVEMLLRLDLNSKVVDFGEYKDAGELFEKSANQWPKVAKTATEGVEWLLLQESKNLDLQFIENKKKVLKAMLPILGLITDQTRLDHYVSRLAVLTESKPESIYQSLTKVAAPTPVTAASSAPLKALPLTSEEQLLALLLMTPTLLSTFLQPLKEVVWQSQTSQRIADALINRYNDKTLVKNQGQFLTQVKNHLDSQLAEKIHAAALDSSPASLGEKIDVATLSFSPASLGEKIDSWLFSLTATWPELGEGLAKELISEKIGQLSTKQHEQHKESLATKIRLAQEKGDVTKMKQLLQELSSITKQGEKK